MPVTRRVHFDSVCINPWRNNKGTAVGAFDLWERANAGRLSEIDAGSDWQIRWNWLCN